MLLAPQECHLFCGNCALTVGADLKPVTFIPLGLMIPEVDNERIRLCHWFTLYCFTFPSVLYLYAFTALMLLVGCQEGHPARKNLTDE